MKKRILFLVIITFISLYGLAQNEAKRTTQFNLEKKVAIQGYDPVSYFKGKPVKGKSDISTVFQGVIYNFSSLANKETFTKNPSGYEPQYGGWCAYAMGTKGEKVEINPETFKIVNGKLYLFYNAYFNNTLKDWNKNEVNLMKKADINWKNISQL